MISGDSPPIKKRKVNDDRATPSGAYEVNTNDGGGFLSSWISYFSGRRRGASSVPHDGEHLSQMDRMEKIMLRMEEKCSMLEDKCSSLEKLLVKVETKFEYHEMLIKNQSWKYSAPVHSLDYWLNNGYDEDEADYLSDQSEQLKNATISMRRGEFPDKEAIALYFEDPIVSEAVNNELFPHWEEFAAALKQFTPAFGVLPDDCESEFSLENVQMNYDAMLLIKDALMNKPFQALSFIERSIGNRGGMTADAIMDVIDSNEHLRRLHLVNYRIDVGDIWRICAIVRNRSIVHLNLHSCFEIGLGDEMMTSLLTVTDLKLKTLNMSNNGITSSAIKLLSDFLASNPLLEDLDLSYNSLNDNDAMLIANALRSNTSLRKIYLFDNIFTEVGNKAFDLVLNNDSSLNSVAGSNHSCCCNGIRDFFWEISLCNNNCEDREMNRGHKIYKLLSSRNNSVSNVEHFDDIDVTLLPQIVEAVQKYANMSMDYVNDLSIVYEVMRKWDKAFPLYKLGGGNIERS
jgi:hypothetical protein